jgi:hypothetical protein
MTRDDLFNVRCPPSCAATVVKNSLPTDQCIHRSEPRSGRCPCLARSPTSSSSPTPSNSTLPTAVQRSCLCCPRWCVESSSVVMRLSRQRMEQEALRFPWLTQCQVYQLVAEGFERRKGVSLRPPLSRARYSLTKALTLSLPMWNLGCVRLSRVLIIQFTVNVVFSPVV